MFTNQYARVESAREELRYIQQVDPLNPGRHFNDDPKCFARYCNMQANTIEDAGWPLIAHDVRQARDIAHPTFRSDARVIEGATVGATRVDFV